MARPKGSLFNDLAILVLLVPGWILMALLLPGSGAPWFVYALVVGLEVTVSAFLVLSALYLNRWLHYRIGPEAIEVRGIGRWLSYRRDASRRVYLSKIDVQLDKPRYGLNFFSGLAHGSYDVSPVGRCQLHGYGHAEEAVILELLDKTVVLTPGTPHEFLSTLKSWAYPANPGTPLAR